MILIPYTPKRGMNVIDVLSSTSYEPKHIIRGLKFDKALKRYYFKSYVYIGNACVREVTTYVNKHDIFYIQRVLCMISALLSCRK